MKCCAHSLRAVWGSFLLGTRAKLVRHCKLAGKDKQEAIKLEQAVGTSTPQIAIARGAEAPGNEK